MEKSRKPKSTSTREATGASGESALDGIPALEWAVAAVGLVLVAATVALLGVQAYGNGDSPPDIALRVESVSKLRNGYLARVKAVNVGGAAAADVIVEGELVGPSGVAEKSEMSFQYLPPHSERSGGLFFTKDPRLYEVKLTAKGYESP